MTEHGIQNEIRNALAGIGMQFRANVGTGWTGNKVDRIATAGSIAVRPGDVVIRGARPFNTGLPPGFADVFGVEPVTITPDMVGQTVGVFFAGEVKAEGGRVSPHQASFLAAVKRCGGLSGVWRSVGDALQTLGRKE